MGRDLASARRNRGRLSMSAQARKTIPVTITHLEMHGRPERARMPVPSIQRAISVMRAKKPTLDFYRFLYGSVGKPWHWYERLQMSDATLAEILDNPAVEVTVLYVDGVPAGYFELDGSQKGEIELKYFGLMPEFIGLRLGPWLLDTAIHAAWDNGPGRVWVHTCTLDHPKALATYQKAGFAPFAQEHHEITDPSQFPDSV